MHKIGLNALDILAMSVCRSCVRRLKDSRRQYSTGRDYSAAVAALNGLQSNFSIVEAIRKQGPGSNKRSIPDMIGWVRRIGYEVCVVSDEQYPKHVLIP